ncbi:hypothetical protein B0T13DRAFT_276046 [Neurospora crassa]|nr:hypothetical protein B0T13DRAFT_276046 [Neurospora crassa]
MRLCFLFFLFFPLNNASKTWRDICVGIGVSIIAGDPGQMLNSTWQVALPPPPPALPCRGYHAISRLQPGRSTVKMRKVEDARFCNPSLRLLACHHHHHHPNFYCSQPNSTVGGGWLHSVGSSHRLHSQRPMARRMTTRNDK